MCEMGEKCKQCENLDPAVCNQCELFYDDFEPIQTNADRIRGMTDEELAEWLYALNNEHCDSVCPPTNPACMVKETCVNCWLDFLKDEVK